MVMAKNAKPVSSRMVLAPGTATRTRSQALLTANADTNANAKTN